MTDGLPPPPAYHSLFDSSAASGAQPSGAASVGGQHSSFPPSHPFYPGPQGGYPTVPPPPGGPTGYCPLPGTYTPAGPTYPSAPPPDPGYAPPPDVTGLPEKLTPPEKQLPPDNSYPQPTGATYPPPAGAAYPPPTGAAYPPPAGAVYPPPGPGSPYTQPISGQPGPSDPLLNPTYPPVGPGGAPNYNTAGAAYPYPPPQGPITTLPEIPVIIEDQPEYPINPKAPRQCTLGNLNDYPHMLIAEGQRQHIDQLNSEADHAIGKWCCVAFWSIGAHVSFFVCIVLLVWQVPLKRKYDAWWYQADRNERLTDSDQFEYNAATLICASVFLCVCYLIAVIEGCASDTDDYVQNVNELSDFRQNHDAVRNTVPIVVWRAEAFHQAKERVEWKNGVIVSRRRSSHTHNCVSYQEEIAFPFSKCVDASGDLKEFKRGHINRFEFEKTFGFLDEHTANMYKRQKEAIISRVKAKDVEHSFEEVLVLPDFKERSTVFTEEGCRTSLMSGTLYNCLTCILCTWPYRIFFRCATTKRRFTYVKLIGM